MHTCIRCKLIQPDTLKIVCRDQNVFRITRICTDCRSKLSKEQKINYDLSLPDDYNPRDRILLHGHRLAIKDNHE